MQPNNVVINFTSLHSKQYLQFDFPEFLSEPVATVAIAHWNELMETNTSKISLIYNCTKMTGFDTNARRLWQDTMKAHKNQIHIIWLVSDNLFIRGAAKTMGLLAGFPIKVTQTLTDIKE